MAHRDPALMTRTEHRDAALDLLADSTSQAASHHTTRLLLQAQLHLSLSTHPDTPEDPVAGEREAFPETEEYVSGWSHAVMMHLLHDRIPGFAIVRPRDTDPFEANKEVLAEYGITDRAGMIAVAHAPHGSPHAHPRKIN